MVLIHVGAVNEGSFDCVTEKVEGMGLVWGIVTRGEEQYLMIYPLGEHPALSRPELHSWYRQR
jgi:hypothetical protein